jgi:hypothetical protein
MVRHADRHPQDESNLKATLYLDPSRPRPRPR